MSPPGFTVSADGPRPTKAAGRGRGELLVAYHYTRPPVPVCNSCDARYALLERRDPSTPLEAHFVCWCGSSLPVTFDDLNELDAYVHAIRARQVTQP